MDPWDLLDPVDIIKKFPKELDDQLASKKWQERKAALEAVNGILNENPKLADNPDYAALIETFTKLLGSDANINCAALAAKNLTGLAKGLRNKFGPYAASVSAVVFEKFKEKRAQLRDPLVELIDALFATSNLTALSPTILEAAGKSKTNPSQKTQLDLFIYRIFRTLSPNNIPKGLLKDLVAVLTEHVFDPDPEVRDSSLAALGAIQKCIGEKALSTFMPANISNDATKMAKLTEYKTKAETEAAALFASAQSSTPNSEQNQQSTQAGPIETNNHPKAQISTNEPQIDPWDLLDPVDITKKFPNDLDEQLASKKWQERKAALEAVNGILNENPKLADNPDYARLIETFTKILGSDANINCAAQAAKNLTGFSKGLRNKFGPHCASVASIVFDKFKEKRAQLRDPLVELIDAIFASSNLTALSPTILEAAGKSKANPSQKTQLDLFIYRIFRTLSPKDIPKGLLKDLVAILSDHAFDSDPEVRDSSLAAFGAMQKCIGEKALSVFLTTNLTGDATKMAKITEYKEKVLAETGSTEPDKSVSVPAQPPPVVPNHSMATEPPPPVFQQTTTNNQSNNKPNDQPEKKNEPVKEVDMANETLNQTTSKSAPVSEKNNQQRPVTAAPIVEARNPMDPIDIMPKLPKEVEQQLGSKNWQDRSVALDALARILAEYPRLTDNPDYRPIIEQLTKILSTEMNIGRATLTANCLTSFANGLRNKFGIYAATVAPIVFEKFKEKKPDLREPLVELLDAIYANSNLSLMAQSIMEASTKQNPTQKAQLDQFLYRVFRSIPQKDIPKGFVKDVVTFLSDHSFNSDSDVRESSLSALGAIMKCVGEKPVATYLSNKVISDPAKMAKIAEYKQRAFAEAPISAKGQSTPLSTQPPARARSASGTRRMKLPSMNDSMAVGGADDSTIRLPRRTHTGTGISSAQSYASALNTTFAGMPSGGMFQLDPKFFDNDFDEPTLTMNNTTNNFGEKAALNSTFTKAGPAERGVLSRNGAAGGASTTNVDQQDLQPIKPVVRPTSTFSRRSESVSSISSLESAEHIDRAVHNVSSLQLKIAEESIAQLLHLLNDPSNRQYLSDRIELTLREIVTQIFHIRGQHLEQLETAKEADMGQPSPRTAEKEAELDDFMRSICNFLTVLTKDSKMMQKINSDALRAFIDAILCLLNDKRLKNLNSQIFRSLNVIIIRLCDSPNPNSCFVALMKLIAKYQTEQPESKMNDLLRKCMIKHTDVLADPNRVEQIDTPTVLEPIHQFYSKFYVLNEKQEVDEGVKQTVKVLSVYVQRLVLNKRYSILNHLYQFPENSHIVSYVRRCVRAIGKRAADDTKTMEGGVPMPEEMEKLFDRISEDLFCGAVEDLYNLMDIHPEQSANFEALMAKCDYSCIVRKAFNEIRQCRFRMELVKPGVCVRRVLPEETRIFLDQLKQLDERIDDIGAKYQLNGMVPPQTQKGGTISQKSTST